MVEVLPIPQQPLEARRVDRARADGHAAPAITVGGIHRIAKKSRAQEKLITSTRTKYTLYGTY